MGKNRLFEKPFSLSIGPQRAASTWIDRYLRWRRDVCLPSEVKEIFFFDRHYQKGPQFYKSHFNPEPRHKLIMEVSATYFDCAEAPGRVYETLGPEIKMICPLRDPVKRSYSLYKHYLRYGIVNGDLKQAVEQKPQIIESSRYADHLDRWFYYFDRQNIKILLQEILENDPDRFVNQLCDGLDIPTITPDDTLLKRVNPTTQNRNAMLASIAQNSADWLRERRIYWPVNMARRVGLKSLIFGREDVSAKSSPKSSPKSSDKTKDMPEEDHKYLHSLLSGEVKKLENLLGHSLEI